MYGIIFTCGLVQIQNRITAQICIERIYYDPFGRRLWKEVQDTRTYFHYSGNGLIGEYDHTGAEIKTYGYKPGSTWTTDPLFVKENGQYYFYHNDHLGTPQKITAVNGAVVWSAKYSSFGKATVEIETVENNLRFPGQYYDSETGLNYNFLRYYDLSSGRYLIPDSIGLAGGINFFAYVQNDPINWIDPWGLARFGYRPLDKLGFIPPEGTNPYDDKHNTEWIHEQLYFDDGAKNPDLPSNRGFFGDHGIWNEPGTVRSDTKEHNRDEYTFRGPIYDDEIMRKALNNLEGRWNESNYNVVFRNCQDFNDALRKEYFRLGGKVTWPTPCEQ